MTIRRTAEHARLHEAQAKGTKWRRWGTYLSERQWGTVREDYSADGDAWRYCTHEQAIARAYRWGEDGLLGMCDNRGLVSFSVALWNHEDPMLKERLFGLTGPEGNHGEDVKELYWYLDATPTHSYARGLYKYPHAAFPIEALRAMAANAGRDAREPELLDTGVFDDDRYFDLFVEYAKGSPEDICIRVSVTNRGPVPRSVEVLPQIWFRNVWSWLPPDERAPEAVGARAIPTGTAPALSSWRSSTWGSAGSTWRGSPSSSSRRTRRTRTSSSTRPTSPLSRRTRSTGTSSPASRAP